MRVCSAVAAVAVLAVSSAALAQRASLKVGSQAPGLDIEKWVKGEETAIEKDHVYVIEFWATWCVPCRQSIPHLTELQDEFGIEGVTIIGVSTDTETAKVEPFVRQMGSRMEYTVAIDNRGATARNWMQAAGVEGIPAAFIVDQRGIIQFIGHPMQPDFGKILGLVVDGRYDARLYASSKGARDAIEKARKQRNWNLYFRHVDELIATEPRVFAPYVVERFETMLLDMDDPKAAYEYANKVPQEYATDPGLMVELAHVIAFGSKVPDEKRNNEIAMMLTERALPATRAQDHPKIHAVQARIHFNRGEFDQAVALQKRAYIEVDRRLKDKYNRTLRTYMDEQRQHKASIGG